MYRLVNIIKYSTFIQIRVCFQGFRNFKVSDCWKVTIHFFLHPKTDFSALLHGGAWSLKRGLKRPCVFLQSGLLLPKELGVCWKSNSRLENHTESCWSNIFPKHFLLDKNLQKKKVRTVLVCFPTTKKNYRICWHNKSIFYVPKTIQWWCERSQQLPWPPMGIFFAKVFDPFDPVGWLDSSLNSQNTYRLYYLLENLCFSWFTIIPLHFGKLSKIYIPKFSWLKSKICSWWRSCFPMTLWLSFENTKRSRREVFAGETNLRARQPDIKVEAKQTNRNQVRETNGCFQ